MRVIDQREIQSRGGVCAGAPVSCLLKDMLIHNNIDYRELKILDTTYGEGRFYLAWRPRLLLGSDIMIHEWKARPDWFTLSPAWEAWSMVKKLGIGIDMVVSDPPWSKHGHTRRKPFNILYGTPEDILRGSMRTAEKTSARYLLIHYPIVVELEKWETIDIVEFHPVSRYINNIENIKSYFILMEKRG